MIALHTRAYRAIARPVLFSLPPEEAQRVAEFLLKRQPVWRALAPAFRVNDARLEVGLCGLELPNPVGLAAGYDKNCELLPSMAALGFGYVVGGTVTEAPRPGNPKPRVLRLTHRRALINALGFPSKGLEFAVRELEKAQGKLGHAAVVVSVAGVAVDEVVRCHRRLEPLADAIEVNISSPNTAGLRVFHEPPALAELIGRVSDGRKKPLFVKLPPYGPHSASSDQDNEVRDRILSLATTCRDKGADALTIANSRPAAEPRLAVGMGGLSGKPLFGDMVRMVREIRAEVGDRMAINACGGIFSGEDARAALMAGATTVQLLTGLVYRGPGIAREVNKELLAIMERDSSASIDR